MSKVSGTVGNFRFSGELEDTRLDYYMRKIAGCQGHVSDIQGLCVLKKRARQDLQSSFGMNTVVAHASSNGRKTSTAEQADDGIAQSGHDF